jgi:hypothetical protein
LRSKITRSLTEFWGKADSQFNTRTLIAHCVDVAAVAVLSGDHLDKVLEPRRLGFLVALHDVADWIGSPQEWFRYVAAEAIGVRRSPCSIC